MEQNYVTVTLCITAALHHRWLLRSIQPLEHNINLMYRQNAVAVDRPWRAIKWQNTALWWLFGSTRFLFVLLYFSVCVCSGTTIVFIDFVFVLCTRPASCKMIDSLIPVAVPKDGPMLGPIRFTAWTNVSVSSSTSNFPARGIFSASQLPFVKHTKVLKLYGLSQITTMRVKADSDPVSYDADKKPRKATCRFLFDVDFVICCLSVASFASRLIDLNTPSAVV